LPTTGSPKVSTIPRLDQNAEVVAVEVAPKKVLVAESDEVVLVLISHVLARQSYVVDRSLTAAETEAMLENETYDAVLVAPCVADGDHNFLERITAAQPDLPGKLIILAAGAEDERRSQPLGVYTVMRKPVEIYDLLETVRRCVARH
jgi:DNA-binding NtrC family response regulator